MLRTRLPMLVAVAFALASSACGRACATTNAGPDAGPPEVDSAPDARRAPELPKVPVPENLRGVWHLPNTRAAIDLELLDSGKAVWRLSDCVCAGGGCGRWQTVHGPVEIYPEVGAQLYWPTGTGDEHRNPQSVQVDRVRFAPHAGELVVTLALGAGTTTGDAGVGPQTWLRGGACPKCRPAFPGPLPAGAPVACEPDFMFCPIGNAPGFACH